MSQLEPRPWAKAFREGPWAKALREAIQPMGATLMCAGAAVLAANLINDERDSWRSFVAIMLIWFGARMAFMRRP